MEQMYKTDKQVSVEQKQKAARVKSHKRTGRNAIRGGFHSWGALHVDIKFGTGKLHKAFNLLSLVHGSEPIVDMITQHRLFVNKACTLRTSLL